MCGIAGIVAPIGKFQISDCLLRMTDAIVHRGPNDHGHMAGDQMGIGMRRLSIIDVAGGHQPYPMKRRTYMWSAMVRFTITMN